VAIFLTSSASSAGIMSNGKLFKTDKRENPFLAGSLRPKRKRIVLVKKGNNTQKQGTWQISVEQTVWFPQR